ncbi:MAG: hypothetical protein AAF609_07115 [Cyanobacteria bacterium P01_C01_bin.120]
MLPNLSSFLVLPEATFSFEPNFEFLDSTAILDLVDAFSPDAAAFVLDGIDTLNTATGDFDITSGVLSGTLVPLEGDAITIEIDAPTLLTEAGELLADAVGDLSLVGGIVNANLTIGDTLYEVTDFDLATFAADGFDFLVSEVETAFPIDDGALLVDIETPLGLLAGVIDLAGGDLDIDLATPAGDLDFSVPFSPEAQIEFDVPTPVGDAAAVVNFFTGNIEVPLAFGMGFDIPLDSLSGELALSDGTATLALDTPLSDVLGQVETSFEVDELVGDAVFDFLTGVSIDASLLGSQLDLLATSTADETFETSVDLAALNEAAIATLTETNGALSLDSGLLSGTVSVGADTIEVAESVDDLFSLLTGPLSDLLALSPAAV